MGEVLAHGGNWGSFQRGGGLRLCQVYSSFYNQFLNLKSKSSRGTEQDNKVFSDYLLLLFVSLINDQQQKNNSRGFPENQKTTPDKTNKSKTQLNSRSTSCTGFLSLE